MPAGDEIPPDLPQIGDELAGQYEILGVIATGGRGTLLQARQKSLRRTVAIKVLTEVAKDRSAVERFLREARAAGQISEPHVVSIYDCGFAAPGPRAKEWLRTEAGVPFLVMECMRGLEDMVSRLHARLIVSRHSVEIEHLSTSHGTFVNGLQVQGKRTLKENDRILIGTSIMKLTKKGSPQPPKSDSLTLGRTGTGRIAKPLGGR